MKAQPKKPATPAKASTRLVNVRYTYVVPQADLPCEKNNDAQNKPTELIIRNGTELTLLEQKTGWCTCLYNNEQIRLPSMFLEVEPEATEKPSDDRAEGVVLVAGHLLGMAMGSEIPLLDTVLGLGQELVAQYFQAIANRKQLLQLCNRVYRVYPVLQELNDKKHLKTAQASVVAFGQCIQDCIAQAKKWSKQNVVKKTLLSSKHKDRFESLNKQLNQIIDDITVCISAEQVQLMEDVKALQQEGQKAVAKAQELQHKDNEVILQKFDVMKAMFVAELQSIKDRHQGLSSQSSNIGEPLDEASQQHEIKLHLQSMLKQLIEQYDSPDHHDLLEILLLRLKNEFDLDISLARKQRPPLPSQLTLKFDELCLNGYLRKSTQDDISELYSGTWLEMPVVIKNFGKDLSPKETQEFLREVEITSSLRHPNVTQLLGACLEPVACIVMEPMNQGTLEGCIDKSTLDIEQRVQAAIGIVRGLAYIHRQGIYHRSLSTSNIFVDQNSHAKLSDFGLSKSLHVQVGTAVRVSPDKVWQAPEVLLADDEEQTKSLASTVGADMYSFGLVLWSLFTGKKPFQGLELEAFYQKAERWEHERIELLPDAIAEIVQGCWRRDPNIRFTPEEVITRLKEVDPFLAITPRTRAKGDTLLDEGMRHWHQDATLPAFEAMRQAAQKGNAKAQKNMGLFYDKTLGSDCEESLELSYAWKLRAAKQGHTSSQYLVGEALERGDGVIRNLEAAISWYQKASNNGNEEAQKRLEELAPRARRRQVTLS